MMLTSFERKIIEAYRENPKEITDMLNKVISYRKECEKPLSPPERTNDTKK